jgi:hypothetical protein
MTPAFGSWGNRVLRQAVTAPLIVAALSGPTPARTAPVRDPEAHAGEAPLAIPMGQEGSGTAWLPASTPMHGHSRNLAGWRVMLHYNLFAGVIRDGSRQGGTEGMTANWLMGMADREAAGGVLALRGMLSLEPLALKREGYPLLLQTGETAFGEPLVDRQHPHDLFMEVALKYDRPFTARHGLEIYVAASGEPALGPAAFPHRASAATNPLAPLAHHWLDSTHIAFGVLTAGVYAKRLKVEGSWFNAREPDEHRLDFDLHRPDSYAGRLTLNPSENWSLQASYGHLREPEALEPGVDIRKLTASAVYNRPLPGGNWATTFAWGRNEPEGDPAGGAVLLETSFTTGPHALFGRAEHVQKSGHDFGLGGSQEDDRLPVSALSFGYSREVGRLADASIVVGGRAFVGFADDVLEAQRYGTATLYGGMIFLHLRPAAAAHAHH